MDNPAFILIFVIAIPIALFFAITHMRKAEEAWKQAASKLGLRFTPSSFPFSLRRMEGTLKGHCILVDTYTTGGKHKTTWTRFRVDYAEPLGLGLKLTYQGMFSGIAKFFGSQDHEIGDPSFDEAVIVQGKNADQIAEFLTPSRRRRIQRLLSGKHDGVVDDRGVQWSVRGLVSDPGVLISNIELGVSVAGHLGSEHDEDRVLDRAIQVQAEGRLDEALEIVGDALEGGEGKDADARVLQGEILYTAGQFQEAAEAFNEVVEASPDGSDTQQWAERATALAASAPSPAPRPRSLDMKEVREELFGKSAFPFEANRVFEEKYQGTTTTWSGTLERAERCTYDIVFGSEPCTKAVFETHELADGVYGARKVRAIVQLPLDVLEGLRSRIGEEVTFVGTLARCDAFTRNLFLKDGQLADEPRV